MLSGDKFKIHIAVMFCVSTYQVMRQQWLERGLTPCPGRAPAGSDPAIPNPCTRQGWVLGYFSHLRAVGPWEHGILPACWWDSVPACSHPAPAQCSQELSALGLLLLPSSHTTPHKEVPAASDDTFGWATGRPHISVHQEKGHSWLLLPHCKSPEQHFSHDLHAHIHKDM